MREWTAGNQLRYYAKSLIAEHDRLNGPIPRVIVRSHYHQYIRETLRSQRMAEDGSLTETTVDVIITPSYCGLTGYARQATRSRNWLLNGLLAIEVEGGRVRDIHPFVKMTDLRVKESL